MSNKKIEYRQIKRGLDSLFVLDDALDRNSQFIDRSVIKQDFTIDSNVTVNISLETPNIENLKNFNYSKGSRAEFKSTDSSYESKFFE